MFEKTRVYHATDHWFQEINFTKTSAWTPKTNGEGPGLYFHLDKQSAVSYARSRRLKYVYTVELFAAELEDFTETENVDAYIRRIASVLECETGVDVLPVLENNLRDVHPAIKDWDMFLGCVGGPNGQFQIVRLAQQVTELAIPHLDGLTKTKRTALMRAARTFDRNDAPAAYIFDYELQHGIIRNRDAGAEIVKWEVAESADPEQP